MSTEKKLTAMQETINYLKENFHLTDDSLEFFNNQLEKEKQQIIDAFNDASLEGEKMGTIYYETEFKN